MDKSSRITESRPRNAFDALLGVLSIAVALGGFFASDLSMMMAV